MKADYVFLLPGMLFASSFILLALKRFFTGYTSKIDQFLDDHFKNTYSYKRYLWLSQDGYEIYRSELEYIDVENELGSLHQTVLLYDLSFISSTPLSRPSTREKKKLL